MAMGAVVVKSNGIRWARHRERMDRNRHIKIIALAAVTIDEVCNSITQSFAKNITRLFFHLRIECTITPMNGYRPISTCPQSAHFWFWSWPWPRLKQTYCQHNLHSYKSFVHSNASNTSRRAKHGSPIDRETNYRDKRSACQLHRNQTDLANINYVVNWKFIKLHDSMIRRGFGKHR